jgi:hypothetical protein
MEFFEKDVKFSFLERIIPEHDAKGARRNKQRKRIKDGENYSYPRSKEVMFELEEMTGYVVLEPCSIDKEF